RAFHAAARVVAGDFDALPEIIDGLALAAETGHQGGAPALFALLAEAQRAAGQLTEAQGTVATGLAVAAQTGQHIIDVDLHRLDGDLLLATGGTADEAAARYHRALAIAREQGSRSFELRAATSLARLLRDQGKRADARALLAPIYEWFTEGFDTGDLIAAKALLEALSCPSPTPSSAQRSSGRSPVRRAMRVSMRGPISSPSWKANTKSTHPSRASTRCDPDERFTDQPIRSSAASTSRAF